jgi:hypothetical protein
MYTKTLCTWEMGDVYSLEQLSLEQRLMFGRKLIYQLKVQQQDHKLTKQILSN